MTNRTHIAAAVMVVAVVLAGPALAQSGGPYDLSWHTIDGGGGTCEAGGFVLQGTIGQCDAGEMSSGPYVLRGGFWQSRAQGGDCATFTDCADLNDDGVRDDNCVWWACGAGICQSTAITFADIGGSFGACPVDGTADANDRFHALNCFANIDTDGSIPYPCEAASPSATNVDAGGSFGQCCPDGVCDSNDAFHALNAFAGANPCQCPANFVCPCPTPTEPPGNPVLCPPGPLPDSPGSGIQLLEVAIVVLETAPETVRPGGLIAVEASLADCVSDLRGYQLHVAVGGGLAGSLRLVDVFIEERKDRVFAGLGDWQAFNVETQQMLAGLDTAGVETRPASLATFVFQASDDAAGAFTIDLLHDDTDPAQRTFLFPTPVGVKVAVGTVIPAVVRVGPARARAE